MLLHALCQECVGLPANCSIVHGARDTVHAAVRLLFKCVCEVVCVFLLSASIPQVEEQGLAFAVVGQDGQQQVFFVGCSITCEAPWALFSQAVIHGCCDLKINLLKEPVGCGSFWRT
eukprot:1764865-Prorocentrum_lima.AAC.1